MLAFACTGITWPSGCPTTRGPGGSLLSACDQFLFQPDREIRKGDRLVVNLDAFQPTPAATRAAVIHEANRLAPLRGAGRASVNFAR